MAFVAVPKDLHKVKSKVLFNLTQRQLICFGGAALVGVPFYLATKNSLGTSLAGLFMVLVKQKKDAVEEQKKLPPLPQRETGRDHTTLE